MLLEAARFETARRVAAFFFEFHPFSVRMFGCEIEFVARDFSLVALSATSFEFLIFLGRGGWGWRDV